MLIYLAGYLSPEIQEMCADRAASEHYSALATRDRLGHWHVAPKHRSPNFLFSFADKGAQKSAKHFCVQPHRRLLIDSGAFTVWSKGASIDLDEYIEFCKEIKKRAKCPVTFASLDVSLGRKGDKLEDISLAKRDEACKEGWANYQKMKKAGIPCLPTFHLGEDFKWLDKIADDAEYVGISPRKDEPPTVRHRWLKTVFGRIASRFGAEHAKKIHGWGISSMAWVKEFPFFSVDRTDWLLPGRTKRYPMPLKGNWSLKDVENWFWKDWENPPAKLVQRARHNLRKGLRFGRTTRDGQQGGYRFAELAMGRELDWEDIVTEHWRQKGVVWDKEMPGEHDYREVNSS